MPRQGGATLLIALLVVMLVVLLATRMGSEYLLLFRTVEAQGEQQQARAYLRGAESVAREALLLDKRLGNDIDSHLELWARPVQLPLAEGMLQACLTDLQARLNLNDLYAPAGEYSAAQLRFIRLLQVLPLEPALNPDQARELAHAVFDWVDADNRVRYPGGGEVLQYLRHDPPYRPANQPFTDVSELALVEGMTGEILAALTPHVSVWGNGALNFNTLDHGLSVDAAVAREEAVPLMLRTLNDTDSLLPLTEDAARMLADLRSSAGGYLGSLEALRQGAVRVQGGNAESLGVSSDYFALTAQMRIKGRSYVLSSAIHRGISATGVPFVEVLSRKYHHGEMDEEADCTVTLP